MLIGSLGPRSSGADLTRLRIRVGESLEIDASAKRSTSRRASAKLLLGVFGVPALMDMSAFP
jgi:hypothetical protein